MSESKLNQERDQHILANQPNCIFCGGMVAATTVDHIPPKTVFRARQWPEGFIFPSCIPCNNGSRVHDYMTGLMAKFADPKDLSVMEQQKLEGLLKYMVRHYPDAVKVMQGLTVHDKRAFSRQTGLLPQPGETYADLPVMGVPDEFNQAMKVQAAKVTKALHFKHTGLVVPIAASIRFRWFTNANVMRGDSPLVDDVMRMVQPAGEIRRNNATLKDQFDYKYAISPDMDIAIYACIFGQSFGFLSFLTFNPDTLENMMVRIREEHGFQNEGFFRAEWPIP